MIGWVDAATLLIAAAAVVALVMTTINLELSNKMAIVFREYGLFTSWHNNYTANNCVDIKIITKEFICMIFIVMIFLVNTSTIAHSSSALEKMYYVFVGDYSNTQIKKEITKAMRNYGISVTEDGYNKAGSILVVLRKNSSVPEMEILACMNSAGLRGQVKFPDLAAICATILEK